MTNVTRQPRSPQAQDSIVDDAPIIMTLVLDAASQAMFDALRTRHFPPERLVVGAHVTMFHALSGSEAAEIALAVQALCAEAAPFRLHLGSARFLGRGVALDLLSDEAQALRAALRARFAPILTPQDRAPWRPHVTVQNKVSPESARQTWRALQGYACAASILAEAIALWRYRGGPWQPLQTNALGQRIT